MKTLSVTEGRQHLGRWLKRAIAGDDVAFVVDGRVVALRPVEIYSSDYALHEYGVTTKQVELAHKSVRADVRKSRALGTTRRFAGKL